MVASELSRDSLCLILTGAQPVGRVRQLSHSIWHSLDQVQNTASSCASLPGTKEMLINWSEFSGDSCQDWLELWAFALWGVEELCLLLSLEKKRLRAPFQHLCEGFQESEATVHGEKRQQVWIEATEVCVYKAFFTLRHFKCWDLVAQRKSCRLLWKFSKSNWIKPWESRCDFTADSVLSLRLNHSPPMSCTTWIIPWVYVVSASRAVAVEGCEPAYLGLHVVWQCRFTHQTWSSKYSKHSSQS